MNPIKRALITTSVIATLTLTAACSDNTPQGPFITPTPTPTKQSQADIARPQDNPYADDSDAPEANPDDVSEVDLMPFGYDWREYEVGEDAKELWGEELATAAMPRALEALDVAYHLTNVWNDGERTPDDFIALRDYMIPSAWDSLETVIADKSQDPTKVMTLLLYKEPNVRVKTFDGTVFTPDSTPPLTFMVENPRMTVVQNSNVFGDNENRYAFGGTFTHQMFGTTEDGTKVTATYERDVAIYLLPVGNEWYIDGWYATDMVPVQEG